MNQLAQFVWDSLELRTPRLFELVSGLSEKEMLWQPPNGANSVAWQFWHIAEVEDNQIRDLLLGKPKRYPFGCSVKSARLEQYPTKEAFVTYFKEVRELSKQRLSLTSEPSFKYTVQEAHFGTLSVAQVWSSVVTSLSWHSGQIALTYRLLGKTNE